MTRDLHPVRQTYETPMTSLFQSNPMPSAYSYASVGVRQNKLIE